MKIINNLLIPALILSGLSIGVFDNIYYSRYLYLSILFISFLLIFKKFVEGDLSIRYNSSIKSYIFFTFLCFLSILWSINYEASLDRSFTLAQICLYIIIFYNLLYKESAFIDYLLYGIVVVTFFNFFLLFNNLGFSYEVLYFNYRFQGLTGNSNMLSMQMLASILSAIILIHKNRSQWNMFFCLLSIPLSIQIILMTGSKKGLFGVILYLFLLFYLWAKSNLNLSYIFLIFCLFILGFGASFVSFLDNFIDFNIIYLALERRITAFIFVEDVSTVSRVNFIVEGLTYISTRPLFGHGIDTFSSIFSTYSHNNFIEVAFGVGIIGLIIYYNLYLQIFLSLSSLSNKVNRNFIFFILLIMLALDLAYVSYYFKLNLLMLTVIMAYVNHLNNIEKNIAK
jgi:O-antigen ligase